MVPVLDTRNRSTGIESPITINEVSKRSAAGDTTEVAELPVGKCGRRVLLGKRLDNEVQRYITRLRDNGTPVSVALVRRPPQRATCLAVIVLYLLSMMDSLTHDWSRSLLKRMGYVK